MKKILLFSVSILLLYGCSTSSDGNGNSTTTVVPVAPSNLTGAVASTTQINLSWTDNSTSETGFKIERKTGTGTYAVVGTTAADVTIFIDTSLTPSTTYTYRVYSYNSVGNSLTYSNELTLTTSSASVTDIDGNTYQSVIICSQVWTKSNLNVSKYSDGTPIPQVTDPTAWANLTTGAWCYYNNDVAYNATYGKLYNWYAAVGIYDAASLANPALRKKLAPTGYHVPTDAEWTTLTTCLGGESIAGGKMKETGTAHWISPNTDATNSSGFTGLPGGYRYIIGPFYDVGGNGNWWSSSEYGTAGAWYRTLGYLAGIAGRGDSDSERYGFSVRCLRD